MVEVILMLLCTQLEMEVRVDGLGAVLGRKVLQFMGDQSCSKHWGGLMPTSKDQNTNFSFFYMLYSPNIEYGTAVLPVESLSQNMEY